MDADRFDALIRSLHSRRRVVQTLAGLGATVGLAQTAGAAPKHGSGKSGSSKKGSGAHGSGSSFGCTKHVNACATPLSPNTNCPDAPADANAVCVLTNKGKPLCAASGACHKCKRNADCATLGPSAVCIKKCRSCQRTQRIPSVCVVPFTPTPTP